MKKYVYRVKSGNLATADLELEAKVGQAFEILELGIDGGAAGLVATLYIGGEVMTGLPAAAGAENVVPVPLIDLNFNTLMRMLQQKFPEVPTYKVCPGEKLVLTSGGKAGTGYLFYCRMMEDQLFTKDMPGASEGTPRLVISHGKAEWSVEAGATEDHDVDINLNPAGLTGFPYVERVPAGKNYDLLGFATRLGAGSGADISYEGIRMWKKEEAILSPDEAFVTPKLYPYNVDTAALPAFLLPEKLTFVPEEAFKMEVRAKNAGTAAQTAQIFLTTFWLETVL